MSSSRGAWAGPDTPSQQSVYTWLRNDGDFLERYARAREAQADKLAKEILELSDKIEDDNPVRVQRARLQVDSRKWLAARLAPKKYGDHISHDVKGGTNINFQPVPHGRAIHFGTKRTCRAKFAMSALRG